MTDETKKIIKMRLGLVVFLLSAASFVILLSVSYNTAVAGHALCSLKDLGCSIAGHFPMESFFGLVALFVTAISGLLINNREYQVTSTRIAIPKNLEPDEKNLLEMISENGAIFQSELVEKSGLTKVRVTRILDKLEAKSIVERKRRGMTNVVMMKNSS